MCGKGYEVIVVCMLVNDVNILLSKKKLKFLYNINRLDFFLLIIDFILFCFKLFFNLVF